MSRLRQEHLLPVVNKLRALKDNRIVEYVEYALGLSADHPERDWKQRSLADPSTDTKIRRRALEILCFYLMALSNELRLLDKTDPIEARERIQSLSQRVENFSKYLLRNSYQFTQLSQQFSFYEIPLFQSLWLLWVLAAMASEDWRNYFINDFTNSLDETMGMFWIFLSVSKSLSSVTIQ